MHGRMRRALVRAARGGPEAIDRRLVELEREWPLDRVLCALMPWPILAGVWLSRLDRRLLVLPVLAALSMGVYAWRGRVPVATWLRGRGVRTAREIDRERFALKALRGDFAALAGVDQVLAHVQS